MIKIKVFVATRNSDLTEGRGHMVEEGYFMSAADAGQAVKGISTQGSDGRVKEDTIVIYEAGEYDKWVDDQTGHVASIHAKHLLEQYERLKARFEND